MEGHRQKNLPLSFLGGLLVGSLGGLIGLGGAEFRLPLLVGFFGFSTVVAIIINKITSLSVVLSSFIARSNVIGLESVVMHYDVMINILAGSLVGAYAGAHYVCTINDKVLHRIILVVLVALAMGMLLLGGGHGSLSHPPLFTSSLVLYVSGSVAGFFIGVIAAILGVAGGEFIIPTIMILYGLDAKVAGNLSLCISLPTMLVAFFRYSQSDQFRQMLMHKSFVIWIILGSLVGSIMGAILLKWVNSEVLVFLLGVILSISAFKVFYHTKSVV